MREHSRLVEWKTRILDRMEYPGFRRLFSLSSSCWGIPQDPRRHLSITVLEFLTYGAYKLTRRMNDNLRIPDGSP